MTRDEYRDWIREYAPGIGLDPALAEAVWQQESGGSLDTGLRGPELSRGRGAAVGPWQVVPAYHPKFPISGDPVEQGKYAMNYLKEVGPARYYGTGQAPEGQPTTAQYVNQVMERAGRPDVRMAGGAPSQMTPGDPRSGRMNLPPFPAPAQQAPQDSFADTLKPLIGLLAGYAGANGSPQERIGASGLAAGSMQVAENELLDLKQKRADAQRRRQGQDSLDRYAAMLAANPETADIGAAMMVDPGAGMQMYAQRQQAQMEAARAEELAQQYERATGDTAGAARIRAGFSPGAQPPTAEYGALVPVQSPDGKTTQWWRNNRWGPPEQVQGITGSPPAQTPPLQRELKQEGATGATIGKATGTAIAEMPETLATIDNNIKVIDDLIAHPGREYAVGTSSVIPRAPGFAPKDYELKYGQVKGAAFLQAFEMLKGGGQITEIEGQKATQAITDLDLAQSEPEHLKALNTLKDVMLAARARALKKGGAQPTAQSPSGADPLGWRR